MSEEYNELEENEVVEVIEEQKSFNPFPGLRPFRIDESQG